MRNPRWVDQNGKNEGVSMKWYIHNNGVSAVSEVLRLVLLMVSHEVVTLEEAEIVVAWELKDILAYLKAGKKVIQLYIDSGNIATGLMTVPAYKDRFWAFSFVSSGPLLEFIKETACE